MKRFLFLVVMGMILIGIGCGLLLYQQLHSNIDIFAELSSILRTWLHR